MTEQFAFIDTSIFLHYRSFDEVDWLAVLGLESVSLVFAPVTISELNEKKDEPTPKLRQRAASVLKKLETLWEKGPLVEIRSGVKLLVQDVEPVVDYAANQLDYRSQDDRLLASMLQFRATNPGAKLHLVAADFGLRVKAKRHGLTAVCLPDDLKLPEEPDPNEKRIQQLERELLELKRVMPKLELAFATGTNRFEVSIEPPFKWSREDIEREKKLVRLKHKKYGEGSNPEPQGPLGMALFANFAANFSNPSKEAIDRYNTELERFYAKYDSWLETRAFYENQERLTVCLKLFLGNDGTSPGEDIDLFLHFPDGFSLYSTEDLPRGQEEPQPPEQPKSVLLGLANSFPSGMGDELANIRALQSDIGPTNVTRPEIRRTNSFEVNIHVEQLKHNLRQPLYPLFVVFESHEAASSFGFDYHIIAGNLPRSVDGKLHVVIKK